MVNFRLGLCAVCRKNPATQFCDYIMEYHNNLIFMRNRRDFNEINRRGEQYETCDLPICKNCSYEISRDHDLCPHHFSIHQKRGLPNPFQNKRRAQARAYIASKMLNLTSRKGI